MIHADLLRERARLTPSRLALVEVASGLRLTYAELDARVSAAAHVLTGALGLGKGDRLALLAANSVEFVEIFFAAARTGVVLVPLNTRNTPYEIDDILQNATPRVLIADAAGLAASPGRLEGPASQKRTVALEDYARLRDAAIGHPFVAVSCDGEDLLALLYTSGTTGRPKGVRIPHRMVAWNAFNTVIGWQLRDDDVAPVFTPLYHAGGLGVFLTPMFAVGGTVVLHRAFDAGEVWDAIVREGATVVFGVPTIFQMLMNAPAFATADLGRVRWFISGGAPLPQYLIDAYQRRGVTFKQGYGLTEVGVNCFAMTTEDSIRKKGSIGKPLTFTEARLVDGHGNAVAPGEIGELLLRGPHVTQGYWNDAAATADALDADGWFHTGDSARSDAEGFFYIAGRKKDMFISGGVNVYPAEIEAVLLLHPDVQDAAVVGVPHETWGEAGVAFVVARPGTAPSAEALTAHLRERLSRYKLPREFRFVDALPRTAYGKVVKAELQKRL